jgi:two-component system response regulator
MNPNLNNVVFYILVVDDDHDDQYLIRKAITQEIPQAIVESLYDGSEALAYLEKCVSFPNLILLDLNMTKISGKDTMRIIRQNEHLSKVPVVVLTTSRNEKEKQELLALGASGFYTKPQTSAELTTIIREVKEKWLEVFVQG